jgi:hypothetical protein
MRWPIALGVVGMLAGAAILFASIRRLLAVLRDAEVTRMPAARLADVTLNRAGTYLLDIEHPRLDTTLRDARFALRDIATLRDAPSSPVLLHATVAGIGAVRRSVRWFDVAQPGTYRLRVDGGDVASESSRAQLIITRPYAAAMVLCVLGIVAGSGCLIGGVVFTALVATGTIAPYP